MGQRTTIAERDLNVGSMPAFVAEPSGARNAPRVVIAPELFGLSSWIRSVASRLAHEGFRVIAPEIFFRDTEPVGSDRAAWMARIQRLDIPQAVTDLQAAGDALDGSEMARVSR